MLETDPQTGVALSGQMPALRVGAESAPPGLIEKENQAGPDGTAAAGRGATSSSRPGLGLTSVEAEARRAQGLGNDAPLHSSRSYQVILRENIFTFINTSLFVLGLILIVLGRPTDVMVSLGVVLVNVTVSVLQEVRAKRKLDRIALLTRPTATVVRDGQEQTIDPSQIVQGDVLIARPGDQVVADGRLIGDGQADMDKSLLSGESRGRAQACGGLPLLGQLLCQRQRALRGRAGRRPQHGQPDHRHRARLPSGDHAPPAICQAHRARAVVGGGLYRDPADRRDSDLQHPRPEHRAELGGGGGAGAAGPVPVDRGGLCPGGGARGRPGDPGSAIQRHRIAEQRRHSLPGQNRHSDREPHPAPGHPPHRPAA